MRSRDDADPTRKGGIGQPPHRIRSLNTLELYFVIGCIVSVCLLIQAILHDNARLFPDLQSVTSVQLLSVGEATTILLTLLGLYAIECQFRKSCAPSIQTTMVPDGGISLSDFSQDREHRCFLKNSGPGRAVVRQVRYRLEFFTDQAPTVEFNLDLFGVFARLAERELLHKRDYYMPRVSENATFLASDALLLIHVSNKTFDSTVKYLDIQLVYEDILGERYLKEFPILSHYRFPTNSPQISRAGDKPEVR